MTTLTKSLELLPSVRCAVISLEGNIGLVRRSPFSAHNANLWEVTGGQMELDEDGRPKETVEATARREVRQEFGLHLGSISTPRFIELHRIEGGPKAGKVSLTLACVSRDFSGEPHLDHESTAMAWVQLDEALRMPDLTPVSRLIVADVAAGLLQ